MPLLRPRDVDELLERTGIALQADADRARLGPHGALDRKGRPLIVYFASKPAHPPRVIQRFAAIGNAARRIGAEVATPEVAHTLTDWLVFVERASGEELCLADWLAMRPSLPRRRLVAERLRAAVAMVHAHRAAHGALSPQHVLVGEGGEVVLTGLSLRALEPDSDASLAVDADVEALSGLLRALLGAEAEEWTDGGFVAPPLATTGTLTVQSPKPAAAEEHTITDLHRYDSQRPVYPSDRPRAEAPASMRRPVSGRDAFAGPPSESSSVGARRVSPSGAASPVRPLVWGVALLALAAGLAFVVVAWRFAQRLDASAKASVHASLAAPAAEVSVTAAVSSADASAPSSAVPAEARPAPLAVVPAGPVVADAAGPDAEPNASAPTSPRSAETRPVEPARPRPKPGKRVPVAPHDLLEDHLPSR
jgi:hypothetical protein